MIAKDDLEKENDLKSNENYSKKKKAANNKQCECLTYVGISLIKSENRRDPRKLP